MLGQTVLRTVELQVPGLGAGSVAAVLAYRPVCTSGLLSHSTLSAQNSACDAACTPGGNVVSSCDQELGTVLASDVG